MRAALLDAARARLDRLPLYDRPVRMAGVRLVVWPWFFRLPFTRRFDGYSLPQTIVLRQEPTELWAEDLATHELCHVWQMQRHPVRMPLSYVRSGYERNGYEAEARLVAGTTAR